MKATAIVLFVFVALLGADWAVEGNSFFMYQYFAPKYANAQEQVFEKSQPHVVGQREYLTKLRYEYKTADADHKAALKELILETAASTDPATLPADLNEFIDSLKGDN